MSDLSCIYLSVCLSIYLSIYLSINLSTCMYIIRTCADSSTTLFQETLELFRHSLELIPPHSPGEVPIHLFKKGDLLLSNIKGGLF